MKNYIKRHRTSLLFAGILLFSCNAFSASEATKKLIHEVLAKYGISAGGKSDCNTDKEPYYDKNTGIVRCFDNNGYHENNYWSPIDRLCKSCPIGTIVNKQNPQSCKQINCPSGTVGIKVTNGNCPAGMDLFAPSKGICPEGYELKKIINGKCPAGMELIDLRSSCPSGYEMFKQS